MRSDDRASRPAVHRGRPGVVAVVVYLAFALFVALLPAHGTTAAVRDCGLYTVAFVATGVAFAQRARAERRAAGDWRLWAYVAVGITSAAVGSLWVALVPAGAVQQVGDGVLSCGNYLLLYLALLAGWRARARQWLPSMTLDGVIAALAVWSMVTRLFLPGLLAGSDRAVGQVVVTLGYAVAALLLALLAVGGIVLLRFRPDPAWVALSLSLVVVAVGNVTETSVTRAGLYPAPGWVLAIYTAAAVCAVTSTWLSDRPAAVDGAEPTRQRGWSAVSLPGVAGVVGLVLLLPGGPGAGSSAVRWLAIATLVSVGARTLLTFREVWDLASVRREARTDELTGLVNRRGFAQQAPSLLADALARPGGRAALLMIDLDGFKEVNDSLGHLAGDRLLAILGDRLRASVREGHDLLARLGGDEFALVLANLDEAAARTASARIAAVLSEPVTLDGVRVDAAASIGIALGPEHGEDVELLMRRADIAMYRAKAGRTGTAVYDATLADPDGEDRLQRVAELRQAIDQHQLVVHYQPKVDLGTGRVGGVEALVRWQHPSRGLLAPAGFLPLVDSAGLMPALTTLVLTDAVRQAAQWWAAGQRLVVSVNLTAGVVVDEALPERVADLLAVHALPAAALQLEITEESLLHDRVRARAVLAQLRSFGVTIAIDDYGAGYSSLAYLRELPVDELKLDRQFVTPMATDVRAASIVRSTVDLAHSLGLTIVAEGVEHEQAAADLVAFGCDTAQGFYFSHALPADELTAWLGVSVSVPHAADADEVVGWAPPTTVPDGRAPLPRR